MAVNERMVAGDGFMLNFLSVMQLLSAKVRFEYCVFIVLSHNFHIK